jgi:hypothetical protein
MIKKKIKLKKVNRRKYCLNCEGYVEIIMIGKDGYCPNERSQNTGRYLNKLYTIDTKERNSERRENG